MSKETRATAERICAVGYQGGWQNQQALTEAIDAALQIERENAALAAKDYCDRFDKPSEQFKAGLMAAIREGKP